MSSPVSRDGPVPGPAPHGGTLVDLRVEDGRAAEVAAAAEMLPGWELTRRQRCDLELLATGGFSPLQSFLGRQDYESVCATMRLSSGTLWPIPVTLDLPEYVVAAAEAAGGLTLRARGVDVAVLWFRESWRPDRSAEAEAVFGTSDPTHPGVRSLLEATHPWYASGPLEVLRLPVHHAFRSLRHTPAEVRRLLDECGWGRVVAFQTRNPMHRAHQQLTVQAARELDAGLLLHPVVGITKPGDVDPYLRVRCYRALLPTYPRGSALLSLVPLAMRMAGPREALWHAIVRLNHGATHFIVGRDHAGPGLDARGRPFYEPYASQELVRRHEAELGIGIVAFPQMLYDRDRQQYARDDEIRPGRGLRISGTEQRRRLARGEDLPGWFTPPEVAEELRRAFPPRTRRGVCLLLRVGEHADRAAAAVAAQLREIGRTTTVLDGFVWGAAGMTERLVAHLVGEIMRNGGAVVCSGELAHLLARSPACAAPADPVRGQVFDVRDDGQVGDPAPSPAAEGDDGPATLFVPPGSDPDLVADLVARQLRAQGYLPAAAVAVPPPPHPRRPLAALAR